MAEQKQDNNSNAGQANPGNGNGKNDSAAAHNTSHEGEKPNGENAQELKEKLLRAIAEFDNYKKRTRQEIDNAKKVGKAELIKSLLPIIDEFELAIIAADKNAGEHGSDGAASDVARGIKMVYSNMMEVLKKEGLSEIDTKGKFDPYKHEIMLVKESNVDDGSIIEVVKKGYMYGEIMLRPASVIISKKAEQSSANEGKKEKKE